MNKKTIRRGNGRNQRRIALLFMISGIVLAMFGFACAWTFMGDITATERMIVQGWNFASVGMLIGTMLVLIGGLIGFFDR